MARRDYSPKQAALHAEHQRLLIEFLNTDLELGFVLASLDRKEAATKAVSAIRHLMDRIEDDEERQEIDRRSSELKELISAP